MPRVSDSTLACSDPMDAEQLDRRVKEFVEPLSDKASRLLSGEAGERCLRNWTGPRWTRTA